MKLNLPWRFLALLTLLLYVVLVFVIVRLVIRNIGLIILLGFTAVCLVGGLRLLFSGSGSHARKNIWLVGATVLLLIIEAGFFIGSADSLRTIARFVVLTLAYLWLIALLYKKYWSSRRQLAQRAGGIAQFKKPYLIMNPKSGNGRAMKAHIDTLAANQGIKVLVLRKGNDVEDIARKAVKAGADVLGISGGDGSIGAVVKVAIENNLPIVVLPGGTRCHFARDLGLAPQRIADALTGFHGIERLIDVGVINGRYFLNNASFGLYADIIDSPDYRDHKVAVSRKVISSIVSGQKELYDLQFNVGKRRFKKALQVLIGVNCYDTFNILELGHRHKLDDGVLQITAITKANDKTIKQLLMNLSTTNTQGLYQHEVKTFKVTNNNKKIVAGVDGEREEYSTPVDVRIIPKVLRVIVPPEGVRNRPNNPFEFSVMHKVWRSILGQ